MKLISARIYCIRVDTILCFSGTYKVLLFPDVTLAKYKLHYRDRMKYSCQVIGGFTKPLVAMSISVMPLQYNQCSSVSHRSWWEVFTEVSFLPWGGIVSSWSSTTLDISLFERVEYFHNDPLYVRTAWRSWKHDSEFLSTKNDEWNLAKQINKHSRCYSGHSEAIVKPFNHGRRNLLRLLDNGIQSCWQLIVRTNVRQIGALNAATDWLFFLARARPGYLRFPLLGYLTIQQSPPAVFENEGVKHNRMSGLFE